LWIGFAICALCAAFPLGLAIWVVGWTPGGGDPTEAVWAGAFLGAMALLMIGLCWYLWRKLHPLQLKNVELSVAPAEVRRGGRVQARVTTSGSRRPGTTLEVALVCMEHYDVKKRVTNPNGADYDQRVTEEHRVHSRTVPVDGQTVDTTFDVPAGAPFSYEGDCVSALWFVRALECRPNRRDRYRDEHVWVLP
jgi:hypothetical protein